MSDVPAESSALVIWRCRECGCATTRLSGTLCGHMDEAFERIEVVPKSEQACGADRAWEVVPMGRLIQWECGEKALIPHSHEAEGCAKTEWVSRAVADPVANALEAALSPGTEIDRLRRAGVAAAALAAYRQEIGDG